MVERDEWNLRGERLRAIKLSEKRLAPQFRQPDVSLVSHCAGSKSCISGTRSGPEQQPVTESEREHSSVLRFQSVPGLDRSLGLRRFQSSTNSNKFHLVRRPCWHVAAAPLS